MSFRYKIPEVVSGHELAIDPERGWFSVVVPEASENLIVNPQIYLADISQYAGTAIAATDAEQRRGTYSIVSSDDTVYYNDGFTTVTDTVYTFSADLLGSAGATYYIYFATNAGVLIGEKKAFISTGHWQRESVTYPETGGASRRVYIERTDAADFYTDGWQVEAKQYPTTYFDGDKTGSLAGVASYYWTGTEHDSPSVRIAQERNGGRDYNLSDFGIIVSGVVGLRMPPFNYVSTKLANGGGFYQQSTLEERQFSLVCTTFSDNGYTGLDYNFQRLEAAINPKRMAVDQKVILRFHRVDPRTGSETKVVDIPCVYLGGLEGSIASEAQERFALNFVMPNPYLIEDGSRGMNLSYADYDTNINDIAVYDRATGEWGWAGSGADDRVMCFAEFEGLVYIGGKFTSMDGVANTARICSYNLTTGEILPLTTGCSTNEVYFLYVDTTARKLYVGGDFGAAGGVAATAFAAIWDIDAGTWSALPGGAPDAVVYSITKYGASIYFGGAFANIGGAARAKVASMNYLTSVWTTYAGLPADDAVLCILFIAGRMYVFGSFNDGTAAPPHWCARWVGGWIDSTTGLTGGVAGTASVKYAVQTSSGEILGATSGFTSVGGLSTYDLANWVTLNDDAATIYAVLYPGMKMALDPVTESVFVALYGGGSALRFVISVYDRYKNFYYEDFIVKGGALPRSYAFHFTAGKIFLGLQQNGVNALFPYVTAVDFGNAAPEYAKLTVMGPCTLRRIENITQGGIFRFDNYELLVGQKAVITIQDNFINYESEGYDALYPGSASNSNFKFIPGNNLISVFLIDFWEESGDAGDLLSGYEFLTGMSATNTDKGKIYIAITGGAGNYVIDLYKDAGLTKKVGTGEYIFTDVGDIPIESSSSSGIGGHLTIDTLGTDALITVQYALVSMEYAPTYQSLSEVIE